MSRWNESIGSAANRVIDFRTALLQVVEHVAGRRREVVVDDQVLLGIHVVAEAPADGDHGQADPVECLDGRIVERRVDDDGSVDRDLAGRVRWTR